MQNIKKFQIFLLGISVLPALMIIPAMADDPIVINSNKNYEEGLTVDGVTTEKADVGAVTVNSGKTLTINGETKVTNSTNEVKSGLASGGLLNKGTVVIDSGESKVEFSNNSARQGGAINNSGKLTIKGAEVSFEGNSSSQSYGAAIYTIAGSTTEIFGDVNKFISNSDDEVRKAHQSGGAIHNRGTAAKKSVVKVGKEDGSSTNDFNNNTANANGGAIVNRNTAEMIISGTSTFDTNIAKGGHGGAVYNYGQNDKWEKGDEPTEGDELLAESPTLVFNGIVNFLQNESKAGNGGAVWNGTDGSKSPDVTAKITFNSTATFNGNKATTGLGGAIYNGAAGTIIFNNDATFTDNTDSTGANDIYNDGTLTIAKGKTSVDGGIAGDGTLNIKNGATLNIGDDATVKQGSVLLDGTMIANLTDRTNAIVTAGDFSGAGTLSLIAKSEGEYKVFGDGIFANSTIKDESAVYELAWSDDKTTVTLIKKSVEDIANDNNLSAAASQTVSNLVTSTSDKLNDFGLLAQESLANGDSGAVEHAHKAINPEKTSALQSVVGHIQGTISKLAANRMAMPVIGRAGGDVDLTSGGVWAQGLFNKSKLNGEFNGYTRGVAAGIDGTLNRVFTLGIGYAFNHSDLDLNSRDTEIDSNTVFVYGQYKPAQWYVNATLNYTMSDYTEKGFALGESIDSDYKVNSFGGQIMGGYDFANGITPEVGVRYMHIAGDTYTNSLGIKNKIDDADYLTAILGGKYAKSFAISNDLTLKPEVRLAAKYDMMSDDAVTTVSMPGVTAYSVNGDRLSRFGGEAGLGITMSYKDVDVSLTYDIEVRKDYTSQTGMLKARYNF